jgi:hypothetical protein
MSSRRFVETESQPTQARVAKHRERLKALGVKRLDLSITPEAFESLKSWSAQNNLSYSEAAEQLFLAASAPISSYLTSSDVLVGASQAASRQATVSKESPGLHTSGSMADTSAVSAFFANRQTTVSSKT